MFDLSEISKVIDAVGRGLLRVLGQGPVHAEARTGLGEPSGRPPSSRTAMRCFQDAQPGRPIASDCAEFHQPDGRLIWEEGANADV